MLRLGDVPTSVAELQPSIEQPVHALQHNAEHGDAEFGDAVDGNAQV